MSPKHRKMLADWWAGKQPKEAAITDLLNCAPDDTIALLVDMRCKGKRPAGVSDKLHQRIRVATRRVLNADVAESGEPQGMVRNAYWAEGVKNA